MLIGGLFLVMAVYIAMAQEQSFAASGQVTDEDGLPLGSAIVRIQATGMSVHADLEGYFTLPLPDADVHKLTAWVQGYFNAEPVEVRAGQTDVRLILERHADEDYPGYQWVSAYASAGDDLNCENCHSAQRDSIAYPLSFDEWTRDAHALSAQNPRFLTMYTGTNMAGQQSPLTRYEAHRDYGRQPLVPDPTQPYFGPGYRLDFPDSSGNCATCHAPLAAINAPFETSPLVLDGVHQEGINCDFCHKVWEVRLNPANSLPYDNMTGVLSFEFRRPHGDEQFFAGPFDDVAPGEDTYSPLQQTSAFCAPCHYGVFWDTLIYNSFGEWLASPYSDPDNGQTCQDCHMPPGESAYIALPEVGGLERDPQTIFSHQMPGAFDAELLANTAEIILQTQRDGDLLTVTIQVTNTGAGHHIPTDSPLRQIFLVVEAAANQVPLALETGTVLPEWAGDLAGLPGRYYAKLLEQRWTGIFPTGAYWMPVTIREDTRLPALATDESRYVFRVTPEQTDISITARLLLRRAYADLMAQKDWSVPDMLLEEVHQ